MLDSLTKKDSTPQEVLARAVCSCHPQSVSASSLGLNTTQINFVLVSGKQPCLKLSQADLVAKQQNQPYISLCCIRNFIVKTGATNEDSAN